MFSTKPVYGLLIAGVAAVLIFAVVNSCNSSKAQTSPDTFDTTAGVQAAQWGENVTVTLGTDSFHYESNGLPNHDLAEGYLIPIDVNSQPFADNTIDDFTYLAGQDIAESPIDNEITLKPSYATEATDTSLGQIGVTISGAPLFNDYENMDRSVVALDDNIAFDKFEGHDHTAFVDSCNGHPLQDGSTYHYHGAPTCITAKVDVEGEHSHIIGVLADGFPIYGDKGENGVLVTNADLDACSGHFGATPEFPEGIYHYHLATKNDADSAPYSIDCYKGNVDASTGNMGGPGGGSPGGPPDFSEAAQQLGVSVEELMAALGNPPDFEAAAKTLGISVEELMNVLPTPPQ